MSSEVKTQVSLSQTAIALLEAYAKDGESRGDACERMLSIASARINASAKYAKKVYQEKKAKKVSEQVTATSVASGGPEVTVTTPVETISETTTAVTTPTETASTETVSNMEPTTNGQ